VLTTAADHCRTQCARYLLYKENKQLKLHRYVWWLPPMLTMAMVSSWVAYSHLMIYELEGADVTEEWV
jgi:hypothetical protein